MPAFLIPWLIRGAMVLAVLAAVYAAWYKVDRTCWTTACKDQSVRAEVAESAIRVAQDRATALALLWAQSLEKVRIEYRDRVVVRDRQFSNLRERAGKITNEVLVPIDVPTLVILRDATALANATNPAAAGSDQSPSEAVSVPSGDWTRFAVEAAAAYRDAVDKHMACVAWANEITANPSDAASPAQD